MTEPSKAKSGQSSRMEKDEEEGQEKLKALVTFPVVLLLGRLLKDLTVIWWGNKMVHLPK